MFFSRKQSKLCTGLSAVIKRPETVCFQALGRFETIGSNLRYGIPKEVATVHYHSRKVTAFDFFISNINQLQPGNELLTLFRVQGHGHNYTEKSFMSRFGASFRISERMSSTVPSRCVMSTDTVRPIFGFTIRYSTV